MQLIAEFSQCPNCGSNRRYADSLAGELKRDGFASPDFHYYLLINQGVVRDPTILESAIPFGTTFPVIIVKSDVCMDCGTFYAVRLERDNAKKTLTLGNPPPGKNRLTN